MREMIGATLVDARALGPPPRLQNRGFLDSVSRTAKPGSPLLLS